MEDKDRILAGTFQCQMQVTQQRQLVITGHIYSDDTPAEVNARIDAYQDAMDRQFVRCDLQNKLAQREATVQQLEVHRNDLERLRTIHGSKDKAVPRLTSQQLEILKRGDESMRVHTKNIEILDSMIAAARKKLGIEAT